MRPRSATASSSPTSSTIGITASYLQDEFRLNPKLTLTYGLRYNLELPWTEQDGQLVNLDLDSPSPIASRVPQLNLKGGVGFVGASEATQTARQERLRSAHRRGVPVEQQDRAAQRLRCVPSPRAVVSRDRDFRRFVAHDELRRDRSRHGHAPLQPGKPVPDRAAAADWTLAGSFDTARPEHRRCAAAGHGELSGQLFVRRPARARVELRGDDRLCRKPGTQPALADQPESASGLSARARHPASSASAQSVLRRHHRSDLAAQPPDGAGGPVDAPVSAVSQRHGSACRRRPLHAITRCSSRSTDGSRTASGWCSPIHTAG